MNELIYKIETIVRNCGTQILQAKNEKMNIEKKEGIGNIVTEYDKKIQKELKEKLLELLPDAKFIGEEDDLDKNVLENGYTFIVDLIDGTTNFSRHFSLSAISVGLLKDAKPYIAVCYNPYLDEMYIAQKNKGAYLNNKSLKVSDKTLSEGIVLSGNAPYYKELREKSIQLLNKFSILATDFRRFGSAVIELCNIACGRAEVYFELKLQPWDYAAGLLIVEEAGGKVTTINGKQMSFNGPNSILATNNKEDYIKYIL